MPCCVQIVGSAAHAQPTITPACTTVQAAGVQHGATLLVFNGADINGVPVAGCAAVATPPSVGDAHAVPLTIPRLLSRDHTPLVVHVAVLRPGGGAPWLPSASSSAAQPDAGLPIWCTCEVLVSRHSTTVADLCTRAAQQLCASVPSVPSAPDDGTPHTVVGVPTHPQAWVVWRTAHDAQSAMPGALQLREWVAPNTLALTVVVFPDAASARQRAVALVSQQRAAAQLLVHVCCGDGGGGAHSVATVPDNSPPPPAPTTVRVPLRSTGSATVATPTDGPERQALKTEEENENNAAIAAGACGPGARDAVPRTADVAVAPENEPPGAATIGDLKAALLVALVRLGMERVGVVDSAVVPGCWLMPGGLHFVVCFCSAGESATPPSLTAPTGAHRHRGRRLGGIHVTIHNRCRQRW